jgi:uncharacterized protein YjbI with pentapeptide repeats
MNREHYDKLMEGVVAWNKWRRENLGIKPNLLKADLKETNLQGANLKEADLRGADLKGANLQDANLEGANLKKADFGVRRSEEIIKLNLRTAKNLSTGMWLNTHGELIIFS